MDRRQTVGDFAIQLSQMSDELLKIIVEAQPLLEQASDDLVDALDILRDLLGNEFSFAEDSPQRKVISAVDDARCAVFTVLSLVDPETSADVATMEEGLD